MRALIKAGRLCLYVFAAIGFVTVLAISTPIVEWWARAYAGPIDHPHGDILIVLGAAGDDNGGISYSSYWRIREAVYAWQTEGFKKIVISGGGPGLVKFLVDAGVPRNAIVAEWASSTTTENAIAVQGMVQNMPGKKVLLTSDFHMYRALRVFRKQGIDVTPLAVPDVLHDSENWYGRFNGFQKMLIETGKIVYYALRGWI
jgi:uncharacterized SAM-binding protein YcdF (DUF218 family)